MSAETGSSRVPSRIVVVGSGRMGRGIAAAFARLDGTSVAIAGRDPERCREAAGDASRTAGRTVRAVALTAESFAGAELAIETVIEDLEVKRQLLPRVEGWLDHDAVLATNTSSFQIAALSEGLQRPRRFAGMHFLNPAESTRLVEVVCSPTTDEDTVARLECLVKAAGRKPIVMKRELEGFVWNRLQFALLRECLHILDAGAADIETIDAAVSDGLAPRWLAGGPFACADLGGIETFAAVAQELFPRLASAPTVSAAMTSRAAEGATFYDWTEDDLAAIASLRGRALAAGSEFADERRAAMPGESRR